MGFSPTYTKLNPFGSKRVGEVGSVGLPPAIVNAALDALRPLGVCELDMPLTPHRVWQGDPGRDRAGASSPGIAFSCLGYLEQRLFEINVFGTIMCCREAVRRMSTARGGKGGKIVNVSSVAAVNGSVGERVHYAASKGAVNSFSIGLSREVAREGLRVNVVSPGLTRTGLNPPERLARLESTVPVGRIGEPEEIARGILWLMSDDADYCVGANIVMSGGR